MVLLNILSVTEYSHRFYFKVFVQKGTVKMVIKSRRTWMPTDNSFHPYCKKEIYNWNTRKSGKGLYILILYQKCAVYDKKVLHKG